MRNLVYRISVYKALLGIDRVSMKISSAFRYINTTIIRYIVITIFLTGTSLARYHYTIGIIYTFKWNDSNDSVIGFEIIIRLFYHYYIQIILMSFEYHSEVFGRHSFLIEDVTLRTKYSY